jgi:hypothetical protein
MWLDCQANMQSSLAKIRHGIRYLVLERVSPFWVWEWFQVACEPTWRHLTHDISWLRKDIEMFQDQVRFLGFQGWSSNLKTQQDPSWYIHAGALDQRPKGNSSFVCPKLWGFLPTSSGTCSCISIQKHNLFLFLFHRIAITGQLRELPDDTFSRSMHTLVSKKKAQLNKGDLDSRHWWIRNNVACDWQVAIFFMRVLFSSVALRPRLGYQFSIPTRHIWLPNSWALPGALFNWLHNCFVFLIHFPHWNWWERHLFCWTFLLAPSLSAKARISFFYLHAILKQGGTEQASAKNRAQRFPVLPLPIPKYIPKS